MENSITEITEDAAHRRFQTTSSVGLDYRHPAMRLYQKAKKFGVWDPMEIDLAADRHDWERLTDMQRDYVLRLVAQFQGGEEAVTLDLLPLIGAIAQDGRIEEELFLTTFLFEEGKHTEFFRRFLTETARIDGDLHHYHTPGYTRIFYEELPRAMNRLWTDRSREAQAEAAATYNMFIEGVLAETGYFSFYRILDDNAIMPGLRRGVGLIQRDEARHIGYGVYLLSRLAAEEPGVYDVIERHMNALFPSAMQIIEENYSLYDPDPFGVERTEYLEFAASRFRSRMARIEKSRSLRPDQLGSEEYEIEAGVRL